jgi:60 kDa SS-A/Ro ribonucleoprotein
MKFVKSTDGSSKTTNYMGETAYNFRPKETLLNITTTCMFGEPKYYEGADKVSNKIFEACDAVNDPEFILKLAVYLRNEMYLRTTSLALLTKVANMPSAKGTGLIKKYAPSIIKRADEPAEVIAAQLALFKKPIPNSLKKGIASSLNNFDEYQLTKWTKDGTVKTKDVLKITHPRPINEAQRTLFKKILENALGTAYTWESELSANKGTKAEIWTRLIQSKKVGYMATLRNLRNIAESGTSEIDTVVNYITNPKAVAGSKQLPFRFLSAYEALAGAGDSGAKFESESSTIDKLRSAVSRAIEISADTNIPKIRGRTVIISDNSGSARGDGGGVSKMSTKSVRTMADQGNLLGLLAWYASEDTIYGVFGDRLILVKPDRKRSLLENFTAVNQAGEEVGQGTETGVYLMLEKMIAEKIFADRIIVCSDLQIGDGSYHSCMTGRHAQIPELVADYRTEVNPNFMYYSICFNGHGNNVIVGNKSVLITGWSDKIFQFINTVEQDSNAQIKYIENIQVGNANVGNMQEPSETEV